MYAHYQDEQRQLQASMGKPDKKESHNRDAFDRSTEGHVIHSMEPTAKYMSERQSNRLYELEHIFKNYVIVSEPADTKVLMVGHIAEFVNYESPLFNKTLLIGAYGEANSNTTPTTIGYEKVLPFMGQRVHHDALIEEGPMVGDWELIRIELNLSKAANAA